MTPLKPTARFIEGLISFHESGLELYERMGDKRMIDFSREQLKEWRQKLDEVMVKREPGMGE